MVMEWAGTKRKHDLEGLVRIARRMLTSVGFWALQQYAGMVDRDSLCSGWVAASSTGPVMLDGSGWMVESSSRPVMIDAGDALLVEPMPGSGSMAASSAGPVMIGDGDAGEESLVDPIPEASSEACYQGLWWHVKTMWILEWCAVKKHRENGP
jgi:hypothetical protein